MEKMNESKLKDLAKRYEAAKSDENNPAVRAAYRAFIGECFEQFKQIPALVIFTETDPYANSAEMFADIERGRLHVFTGGAPHPLMTKKENSVFRAVHDYFGHFLGRNNFSATGEVKAWERHSKMFSALARRAMDTETIGQVAVYYFGSKPKTYAEQKAVLL